MKNVLRIATLACLPLLSILAHSQRVNEVYAFSATNLASGPDGTPVQGRDGKLYGVVNGSIFRMSPGGKSPEIVYAGNGTGGWIPTSLIFATDGQFYVTAFVVRSGRQWNFVS